jgi:hypothetical protein
MKPKPVVNRGQTDAGAPYAQLEQQMPLRLFRDGNTIYRPGDPCDAIFRIVDGAVILERVEKDGTRVGRPLEPGDTFGAWGVLNDDSRREHARAIGATRLAVLEREQLIDMIEQPGQVADSLIAILFSHAKIASSERDADGSEITEMPIGGHRDRHRILLLPGDPKIAGEMGVDQMAIERLPFVIGRRTTGVDRTLFGHVDLSLTDERPYQISRRHLGIEKAAGGLLVRDYGSHHGTIVNGQTIGGRERERGAPLQPGLNELVAGREDSPFKFFLTVDQA